MTRETIKEYILQVKSQDGTEALYNRWEPDILVEVINEIFNDHETAIEILMKANEEEISRHFNECEKHEAQLKAKDEEIERLKIELDNMCNGYNDPMAWKSVKDDDDVFDTFDMEQQ